MFIVNEGLRESSSVGAACFNVHHMPLLRSLIIFLLPSAINITLLTERRFGILLLLNSLFLLTSDLSYGCGNAGGTKPGEKPAIAGKKLGRGAVPVRTQLSMAATPVSSCGPVKLQ